MAISNYAELKASIINWSHRKDLDLLIDDFISLAEADIYKGSRSHEALQIRQMEVTSTATMSGQSLALPDGFKSMRSVRITDNLTSDITFKTPDALVTRNGTGRPLYYTITNQLEFDVVPDDTYTLEMTYFKTPTPISSANTTNDVLTNHPDIYLFGALWMLFNHAVDDQQAMKYYQQFSLAINGANQADEDGRYSTGLYARINGATP